MQVKNLLKTLSRPCSRMVVTSKPAEPVKLTVWIKDDTSVEDFDTNDQTLWLEEHDKDYVEDNKDFLFLTKLRRR